MNTLIEALSHCYWINYKSIYSMSDKVLIEPNIIKATFIRRCIICTTRAVLPPEISQRCLSFDILIHFEAELMGVLRDVSAETVDALH